MVPACAALRAGGAAASFAAGAAVLLTCARLTRATNGVMTGADAAAAGWALLVTEPAVSAEGLACPNLKDVAPETIAGAAEAWFPARPAAGAAEALAGSDAGACVALARTKPGSTGGPELVSAEWPKAKVRLADERCCASCVCSLTAASACKAQRS